MNPGKRGQRVAFQSLTRTPDGGGGYTETWATQFSRWCGVETISGRERLAAQQLEADRDYRVWAPNDSDVRGITEEWRMLWRGKALNIRFIADVGPQDQEIMFEVKSGVAG